MRTPSLVTHTRDNKFMSMFPIYYYSKKRIFSKQFNRLAAVMNKQNTIESGFLKNMISD
jgi:hypothetical protein